MRHVGRRFGSVILVDPAGRVLLQERDEHPQIDPDTWGFCGGHLEDGEAPLPGALRELAEETGVALTADALTLVAEVPLDAGTHRDDRAWVFAAPTRLTDADIVLGEGRRIIFVEPDLTPSLPLSTLAGLVLPAFLDSALHGELARAAARG